MLTIGGFEFTNDFVPLPVPIPNPPNISPPSFDDGTWAKLKPETPWGFLPTMTLPVVLLKQFFEIVAFLNQRKLS